MEHTAWAEFIHYRHMLLLTKLVDWVLELRSQLKPFFSGAIYRKVKGEPFKGLAEVWRASKLESKRSFVQRSRPAELLLQQDCYSHTNNIHSWKAGANQHEDMKQR